MSCCRVEVADLIHWNARARELVASTKTSPPNASRIYAYLSVALERAVHEAPAELDRVAEAILAFFFPATFTAPDLCCDAAAIVDELLDRARGDGADLVWSGTVPVGPCLWTGTNPLLPLWGEVQTWCLRSGSELRADPPPACDSREFKRALAEVRRYSDHRTPGELRIAQFWADGAGTSTPAGHWNEIACERLLRIRDVFFAAEVLALLNLAMADGGVCCWDIKYAYWLIRPSQADPAITTPVGLPPFPAYTSGHSTFSGAAARILGELMPDGRLEFVAMAEEAAMSRVYGGIHYRFDGEIGLEGGRQVADLVLERCRDRRERCRIC